MVQSKRECIFDSAPIEYIMLYVTYALCNHDIKISEVTERTTHDSSHDNIVVHNSFPRCKHVQNIRERELKIKSLFTKKEKIFETCQITNIQIQEFTK